MAGARRVEPGRIPASRATRLPGARGRALECPIHRSPAAADGSETTHARDHRGPGTLRVPAGVRAAPPRGMEGESQAGVPSVPRRRPGIAAPEAEAAPRSDGAAAAADGERAEMSG